VLVHTDHLIPGMVLDKDIELKAGSNLITRHELGNGRLTEKVIESIQKFSGQIVPLSHRVFVKDDKLALGYIKKVVDEDLYRVAKAVSSGKEYPNFLADVDLHEKVMRVMEMLFTNPEIIRTMYDTKFNSIGQNKPLELILDHSMRTCLLTVALGLRLHCTVISLVCLGMAALLHDMGILTTSAYPDLESIDEMSSGALESFIEEHQQQSAALLLHRQLTINPFQRKEIYHIVDNHHRPGPGDKTQKNALIFHFADLVDEMISQMPHDLRYNFTAAQVEALGRRYSRRTSLVDVMLGLAKLYKRQSDLAWEIVSRLADLFGMKELLSGDFDIKLQEIIELCPHDSAKVNPPLGGNFIPRTFYCSKSNDEGFFCEHLIYAKAGIQDGQGKIKEYFKCGKLGPSFQKLLEGGKS